MEPENGTDDSGGDDPHDDGSVNRAELIVADLGWWTFLVFALALAPFGFDSLSTWVCVVALLAPIVSVFATIVVSRSARSGSAAWLWPGGTMLGIVLVILSCQVGDWNRDLYTLVTVGLALVAVAVRELPARMVRRAIALGGTNNEDHSATGPAKASTESSELARLGSITDVAWWIFVIGTLMTCEVPLFGSRVTGSTFYFPLGNPGGESPYLPYFSSDRSDNWVRGIVLIAFIVAVGASIRGARMLRSRGATAWMPSITVLGTWLVLAVVYGDGFGGSELTVGWTAVLLVLVLAAREWSSRLMWTSSDRPNAASADGGRP